MTIKVYLFIGGVIFNSIIGWKIFEMKNAYELPPDNPDFLVNHFFTSKL